MMPYVPEPVAPKVRKGAACHVTACQLGEL